MRFAQSAIGFLVFWALVFLICVLLTSTVSADTGVIYEPPTSVTRRAQTLAVEQLGEWWCRPSNLVCWVDTPLVLYRLAYCRNSQIVCVEVYQFAEFSGD